MQQNKITRNQLMCIGAICSDMRLNGEQKQTMVMGFSGGRETSSKGLYYNEAIEMIRHLQDLQKGDSRCSKMLGKIFSYAHEIGWTKKNATGKTVADVKRIDEWAVKYSYLAKKVNQYSYNELPKLVTQFESFYKDFLSRL